MFVFGRLCVVFGPHVCDWTAFVLTLGRLCVVIGPPVFVIGRLCFDWTDVIGSTTCV